MIACTRFPCIIGMAVTMPLHREQWARTCMPNAKTFDNYGCDVMPAWANGSNCLVPPTAKLVKKLHDGKTVFPLPYK